MRVTPIGVGDILAGQLAYVVLRSILGGVGFLAAMVVFTVPLSWWTAAVVPLLPLIALAVAAPISALSASISSPGVFDVLFRLGIVPMSLLSGIYFPLATLPGPVRAVALALPLSHGCALVRTLVLGSLRPGPALLDLAVLLAWGGIGFVVAKFAFARKLSD
jgi:lipooligosaccharide transport system permease protein